MKQKLRIFLTLLLCAVASVGWGDEVTVTFDFANQENLSVVKGGESGGGSGSSANVEISCGGIVITSPNGYNNVDNKRLHIYKSSSLGISSTSGIITSVVVTCTGTGTNSYGPGLLSAEGYACPTGSNKGTWEGNSASLTLNASAQVRITKIDVTYTPAASDIVATPSINGTENFYPSTEVSITCNTDGATITYSTDDGNTWTNYDNPFTLTATTTVQAKATKGGMTDSDIAEKTFTKVTPLANIAAMTAETTAGTYYVTLNNAVVTYVNGNYAYIQDASGAVVMYKSGHGLTAGDVLNGTAEVAYQVRNGNPQITNFTGVTPVSGTAPDPTTIAASEWNTPINTVLSKFFKITGATITSSNNKYYVQLGSENVQLYGQGDASQITVADLNATYTIIGFPTIYVTNNGTTPELQIFVQPTPETTVREELTMTFVGGTLEFTDAADFVAPTLSITDESGTSVDGLAITYSSNNTEVATVDASTGEVTICSTYGTAIITANFAGNDDYVETSASYNIVYSNPNLGDYTWDLTTNSYASATENLVTWSSDYATMTLEKGTSTTNANNYLGGTNNQTRLYQNQVLSISPVTGYKVSSVVITAVSSYAEGFTGNSWRNATASTSGTTITVTPTDGSQAVSVIISKACRATAVKVFYEVDSTPVISVDPTSIDATDEETEGTLTVTYANVDNSTADLFFCDVNGEAVTYDWIVADFDNDKNIEYLIDANTGEARTAYLKVKVGDVYSNLVTITQAAYVPTYSVTFTLNGGTFVANTDFASESETKEAGTYKLPSATKEGNSFDGWNDGTNTYAAGSSYQLSGNVTFTAQWTEVGNEQWVLTDLADLTASDVFVIVGDNGDAYAMSNSNGTQNPPAAIDITISDDKITSAVASNLQWNISGNATDGYTFYPNGTTETWLYCTNANNGVRVGTNENKMFVIDGGYLKHVATSRYVGIYNSQDWRCYTSNTGTSNIAGQTFSFYKKVGDTPQPETVEVTISAAATDGSVNYGTLYYRNMNLTVPEGVTAYTASVSNGSLTLSAVTGAIPAGTGVVLKTASKLTQNTPFTFTEATEAGTVAVDNMLLGTDDAAITTAPEGSTGTYKFYALSLNGSNAENSVGFYYRKGCPNGQAFENGAHKAYLAVSADVAGGAKGFTFGDMTDGIEAINNSQSATDKVYNLAGQRVNKAQKGVYIVNGKKVVIR